MPGLKFFLKLFKALHSDTSPNEIAGGFVLGMIIGLTPTMNLHNLFVLFLLFILKVNIAMGFLGFLLFSGFAYVFDPFFHDLGYFILVEVKSLNSFWTMLYNTPIIALTNFNNTVVMGSLISSLTLLLPMFYFSRYVVNNYRILIMENFNKLKVIKLIKGSRLYEIYEKIGA